jgi:hypothetical protein
MSGTPERASEVRYLALLLGLTALIFLVRAPFTASFWLDETITAWIVSGSLSSVWSRSIDFQGQSPFYYILVWAVQQMFGAQEVVLRSLSIVCGGLVVVAVARIARRLSTDPATPYVAIALLVGSDSFQDAVLSARPYALAILCASCSLSALLSLRERYSVCRAALFSVFLVATFYAHYLFAVVGLVHLCVLAIERRLLMRLAPWGILVVVASMPGWAQLLSLSQRASLLSFATLPTLSIDSLSQLPAACFQLFLSTIRIAMPVVAVVSCLMGLLLAVIWDGRIRLAHTTRAGIILLAPYALVPPILFLVLSYISPSMLFVARYWSWSLVPLSLVLALLLCAVEGTRPRRIALVTTLVVLLLRVLSQDRVIEEWRGAAAQARASIDRVVLFSGLIEAEGTPQGQSKEYDEYLRAPLTVYGVEQPIDVVGLTHSEDELGKAFSSVPFTLVAARARRSAEQSPERFLRIIESKNESLSLNTHGRLIIVARVR